uniref:Uncharacterized protein n=1 Tax=Ditylenchus dipsaci TaxID=166011 RepID=A0A915EKP5_9BILA
MQVFLFSGLVIFSNCMLGLAQNSSSTEIITNGRQNCPAAGTPEYDIIPFYDSQEGMFSTNITSIAIVPANGGQAIAEFAINTNNAFTFVYTRPTPLQLPYLFQGYSAT